MTEAILTEQHGQVLLITMNRPADRNAINGELSRGLWAAVGTLDADPTLTVAVLTAASRGFSADMDLKTFGSGENTSDTAKVAKYGAQKPLTAVEVLTLAGAFELALACDIIPAADEAKFGIPEVKAGLFAAGGGLLRLPSRVRYGSHGDGADRRPD